MTRNNSDTAWKEILDAYFKECIELCFPKLYAIIDWNKPWVSLDNELQTVTRKSFGRKCLLDKLVKVFLNDGVEQWILINVEVQAKQDKEFEKRMFIYGYRIFDKYQKAVVSCAVLTDSRQDWRPYQYKIGMAGSYLMSEFLAIKILDFKSQASILEAADNPFSCVIYVQLKALELKSSSTIQRKQVKFALTKRLYHKKYTREQIIDLYRFIDWLIGLPEKDEIEYINEVYKYEASRNMAYICTAERQGIQKGIKLGRDEGMQKGIQKGIQKGAAMMAEKLALFMLREGISEAKIITETGLDLEQLRKLQQQDIKVVI